MPERIIYRPQRLDSLAMLLQALACITALEHDSAFEQAHHDPDIGSKRFQQVAVNRGP